VKQPGEQAGLYYDAPFRVHDGDYLRTGTGRLYLIEDVRVQEGGVHAGRQHLKVVVMEPDHVIPDDAKVHTVNWYPRRETRKARS
jgi:hypothetical protein